MVKRILLIAALAVVLLGAVPESALVEAQDELITAVGVVTDVPPGGTVNSSRIEVRFPAGGGPVTGDWTITFTATIGIPLVDEPCTLRSTISGPLEGRYDGNALNGTSTATNSGTVIARCDGDRRTVESTDVYSWSGRFNGEQASITMSRDEFVIRFIAEVPSGESPDVDEPPDTADDSEEPAGDLPDIAGVFFGTEGLSLIYRRAAELLDCSDREMEAAVLQFDISRCRGAADVTNDFQDYKDAFNKEFPSPSEKDTRLRNLLANALVNAGLVAKDGTALFPSIRAALPVIAQLADEGTTYTVPGQDRTTAAERFVELLAARDAAAWEERFP